MRRVGFPKEFLGVTNLSVSRDSSPADEQRKINGLQYIK
jgi:hypothetical protein